MQPRGAQQQVLQQQKLHLEQLLHHHSHSHSHKGLCTQPKGAQQQVRQQQVHLEQLQQHHNHCHNQG